jgi:hypothetical protein
MNGFPVPSQQSLLRFGTQKAEPTEPMWLWHEPSSVVLRDFQLNSSRPGSVEVRQIPRSYHAGVTGSLHSSSPGFASLTIRGPPGLDSPTSQMLPVAPQGVRFLTTWPSQHKEEHLVVSSEDCRSQCSTADTREDQHTILSPNQMTTATRTSLTAPQSKIKEPEEVVSKPSHKGPAVIGSAARPSIGSVRHNKSKCKPCAFFQTEGCESGINCLFCHLCEAGEKKRRKKALRERRRTIAATTAEVEEGEC